MLKYPIVHGELCLFINPLNNIMHSKKLLADDEHIVRIGKCKSIAFSRHSGSVAEDLLRYMTGAPSRQSAPLVESDEFFNKAVQEAKEQHGSALVFFIPTMLEFSDAKIANKTVAGYVNPAVSKIYFEDREENLFDVVRGIVSSDFSISQNDNLSSITIMPNKKG